uniref:Probable cytosolic iron-sulfur protein assembly protein CIAO1 homolog n=1 Tax=Odontella aurita TaxID=265563 RepID=A0A7S4I437_9STRA|mmetsp:Transcript_1967/g.5197  ORF Transcript_1967/g.5197 Transcript_1967/m.5197 type:complete len:427 (+) Transcript_1967:61-1341(+)
MPPNDNTSAAADDVPHLKCLAVLSPSASEVTPQNPGTPATAVAQRSPLSSLDPKSASIESSPAWQVSWSPDGRSLASCHGAPDPCVRIWSRRCSEEDGTAGDGDGVSPWVLASVLRGGHARTVRSVSFAPTGNVLASASFDGTVAIWERFDDNGIGSGEGGWECTAQLEGHESEVKCVAWNGTGSLLATCGRDKSVWIWESFLSGTVGGAEGGSGDGEFECIAVLHGHTGDVKSVAFAPSLGQWGDGDEVLFSASYDDTIKCWAEDAGDWYCAATLSSAHSSTVWSVAAAGGGARLVSGSADKSLAVWKCYTATERRRMEPDSEGSDGLWKCVGRLPGAHDFAVHSVHCSPSRAGHGRIASGGADDCINVYCEVGGSSDTPQFALDATAPGAHSGDVNCVRWHPRDGSILSSAGDDGLVKVWRYKA